jgi:hypothetical protein
MAGVFYLGGLVSTSIDAFGVWVVLAGLVWAAVLFVKIVRLPR